MTVLGSNIRYLRRKKGWAQDYVSEQLGYKSPTTIQKWESGISEPPLRTLHTLSELFQVALSDLTGLDLAKHEKQHSEETVSASPLPDAPEGLMVAPAGVDCDYCMRCVGDSMTEANLTEGDLVYLRTQEQVENGDIAAVRVGEELLLTRVYRDGEMVMLVPANRRYAPRSYSGDALAQVQIIGKAVGFTHWF